MRNKCTITLYQFSYYFHLALKRISYVLYFALKCKKINCKNTNSFNKLKVSETFAEAFFFSKD